MIILGLNIRHGDSSACLLKDGKLIAASEEERYTGIKHYSNFPVNSIKFCLTYCDSKFENVDYICVNYDKAYNLLFKIIFVFKNIFTKFFVKSIFYLLNSVYEKNDNLNDLFKKYFSSDVKKKLIHVPHHLSHVFSTLFFNEKNENALVFSFDGSGDFSTIESYLVNNDHFKLIEKNNFPHSLGFFYMTFTQYLGFNNYGDEYKLMGLAGYGNPIYTKKIKKIIKSEYPFKLDLKYFNLPEINYKTNKPIVNKLYNNNFIKLFDLESNLDNNDFKQIHKDYAASVQKVFEDIVFKYLRNYKEKYDINKIYLTGGCAFNSTLVGKIIKSNLFEYVKVHTNPGDAGGAVGSAFYQSRILGEKIYFNQETAFLGNSYNNDYIQKNIITKIKDSNEYKTTLYSNFDDLTDYVANKIKKEKVVFWFQDKMEWGPRALGNRSILADPTLHEIKNIINLKIKKRESFRPFAPIVMREFANDYFEMSNHDSKFMNIVFNAKKITSNKFPGVVHVDGTSRVQTVSEKDNYKLYNLLKKFNKNYDSPILINTSLNINGPIAESPIDAFDLFKNSDVTTLILNDWIIEKCK